MSAILWNANIIIFRSLWDVIFGTDVWTLVSIFSDYEEPTIKTENHWQILLKKKYISKTIISIWEHGKLSEQ